MRPVISPLSKVERGGERQRESTYLRSQVLTRIIFEKFFNFFWNLNRAQSPSVKSINYLAIREGKEENNVCTGLLFPALLNNPTASWKFSSSEPFLIPFET